MWICGHLVFYYIMYYEGDFHLEDTVKKIYILEYLKETINCQNTYQIKQKK